MLHAQGERVVLGAPPRPVTGDMGTTALPLQQVTTPQHVWVFSQQPLSWLRMRVSPRGWCRSKPPRVWWGGRWVCGMA